ncbi:uncharacterized protein [Ptychodera flava]|uniref:uncharacterized protein isoform X1 n=1 Tax=Ptychodera flava TaxID=63121 RepID=UPI00396A4492
MGDSRLDLTETKFSDDTDGDFSGYRVNSKQAVSERHKVIKSDGDNTSCGGIIWQFGRTTTIHGLPHVISTKATLGKLLWAILFLSAVGVFVLQASELVRLYLDYDVRVKISLGTAKSLPFPAVTLCNTNMVRQSAIEQSQHALLARTDPKHPDSIHKLLSYEVPCLMGDFMCADEQRCIKPHLKCDGYFHCWDRNTSDEVNCDYPPCGGDEFECTKPGLYGRCIHESKRCDGIQHCLSGEDEMHCPLCYGESHACDFGLDSSGWRCISPDSLCNHYPDCRDGSDEPSSCVYEDTYQNGVCVLVDLEATSASNVFYSARYPSQYPRNDMCSISIAQAGALCVKIRFLELDIGTDGDCNSSYVEIIDENDARLTVRHCGVQTPPSWVSESSSVKIAFVSDDLSQGRGFRFEYMAVVCPSAKAWITEPWSKCSAACGGGTRIRRIGTSRSMDDIPIISEEVDGNSTLESDAPFGFRRRRSSHVLNSHTRPSPQQSVGYFAGSEPPTVETCNVVYCSGEDFCGQRLSDSCRFEIASPGYPDAYGEDIDCVIDIVNWDGCVDFLILEIDTTWSYSCYTDYLQIEDLADTTEDKVMTQRYCGKQFGQRWRSASGDVRLSFRSDSDSSVSGKGYRAVYEFITCGTWQVAPWSECSVTCGTGVRFRQVLCWSRVGNKEIDSRYCPDEKPPVAEGCDASFCSREYREPPDLSLENIFALFHHITDDVSIFQEFLDVYYTSNEFSRISSEIPPDWKGFLTFSSSPDYSDIKKVLKLTKEEMSEYGHQVEDFVLQCSFNDISCSSRDFEVYQNDHYGNCFTFNSGKADTLIHQSTRPGAQYGLKLTLFIEQDEYIPLYGTEAGVRVLIHAPDITPFPEDNGFTVTPGTQTSIGIRRDTVKGSGLPYTNCTDQRDIDSVFGEQYVYSDLACHKNQIERYIARECGCVDTIYMNGSRCQITNDLQELCRQLMEFFYQQGLLSSECREPCSEVQFTKTMSQAQWPSNKHVGGLIKVLQPINDKVKATVVDEQSARDNLVRLEVYYKELNYQNITKVPAYKIEELFGDLGGLLGLYVGLSLMTVAEFLEFFLIALRLVVSKVRRLFV